MKVATAIQHCFLVYQAQEKLHYLPIQREPFLGDDEHGWDDEGIFNFEGGCYAKTINLDKDSEPEIFNAIRRDALLENVSLNSEGVIDFEDGSVTQKHQSILPNFPY